MLLLNQEQADQLRAQIMGASNADDFAAAALALCNAVPIEHRKQVTDSLMAGFRSLTA